MCRVLLVFFLVEEMRNDVMEVFDVIIEGCRVLTGTMDTEEIIS